jgi:hypothetical protein
LPRAEVIVRALKAALFVLTIGALSATHAHARETEIWGGPGGARFDLPCAPGEYLIGLAVSSGQWIDRVAPLCASWNYAEARFNDPSPIPASAGGSGGAGMVNRLCQPGRAVRNLLLRATYAGDDPTEPEYIGAIEMQCWGVIGGGFVTETIGSYSRGLARQYTPCRRNEIATGVIGRAGHFVDALGLTCVRTPLAYGVILGQSGRNSPGQYRTADQPIQGEAGRETPAARQGLGDIPIQGEAGQQAPQSRQDASTPIQGSNDPLPGGAAPR